PRRTRPADRGRRQRRVLGTKRLDASPRQLTPLLPAHLSSSARWTVRAVISAAFQRCLALSAETGKRRNGGPGMVRNSWRRPVLAWSSAVALMSGPLLAACVFAPAWAAPVDVQPRPPAARHLTAADSLVLNGVYCTSAANCWAVGNLRSGNATKN